MTLKELKDYPDTYILRSDGSYLYVVNPNTKEWVFKVYLGDLP